MACEGPLDVEVGSVVVATGELWGPDDHGQWLHDCRIEPVAPVNPAE